MPLKLGFFWQEAVIACWLYFLETDHLRHTDKVVINKIKVAFLFYFIVEIATEPFYQFSKASQWSFFGSEHNL